MIHSMTNQAIINDYFIHYYTTVLAIHRASMIRDNQKYTKEYIDNVD